MRLEEIKNFYQGLTQVKEAIKEFSSVAIYELDGGVMEWSRCKGSFYSFLENREEFVLKYFAQNFPS